MPIAILFFFFFGARLTVHMSTTGSINMDVVSVIVSDLCQVSEEL